MQNTRKPLNGSKQPPTTLAPIETKQSEEKKKEEKRGGARSSVVSRAIDDLINEGWLDDFRKVPEVMEELKRRNVRGAYYEAVQGALNRRVPEKLDRVKDTDVSGHTVARRNNWRVLACLLNFQSSRIWKKGTTLL